MLQYDVFYFTTDYRKKNYVFLEGDNVIYFKNQNRTYFTAKKS